MAGRLGVAAYIDVSHENAATAVRRFTDGVGVNCAVGAVGVSVALELYQQLAAPDGVIANTGVRGVKADLYLETL